MFPLRDNEMRQLSNSIEQCIVGNAVMSRNERNHIFGRLGSNRPCHGVTCPCEAARQIDPVQRLP